MILVLSSAPWLCAELPKEEQAAVDRAVERTLAQTGVPSASIAIVQDGKIAYARAYGLARLAGKVPASPEMRYKIGSNSKQITASAILLLADEGKVSLDDPVSRFFPDLTRAREITIRQLLSHTSGYEDYYALDYVAAYMRAGTTPESIIDQWGKKPLNFDPGTRWQYSNTNFVIAGLIIEKLTHQPLIELLRSRIFGKLGIQSAIDVDRQAWSDGDPLGYTRFALGPSRVATPEGKNWVFAAGELAMTPSDLTRWDISLMNGAILKPSLLKELTTETHLKNGCRYGLRSGSRNSQPGRPSYLGAQWRNIGICEREQDVP